MAKANKKRRRKATAEKTKPTLRLETDLGLIYKSLISKYRKCVTKRSDLKDQMDTFALMGGVEHESSNVSSEIEQLDLEIRQLERSLVDTGDSLKKELDEGGIDADVITRLEIHGWFDLSLLEDLLVLLDTRRRWRESQRCRARQGRNKDAAPADLTDPLTPVHSTDFSSVNWFGRHYQFNKTQALCIKLLWAEWKKGGLALSEKTIAEEIRSDNDNYRLVHTFRLKSGKQHPAWGSMIRPASKGTFRLCAPNHS